METTNLEIQKIFKISKINFNLVLSRLINIVPRKSPMPLLNDIRIKTSTKDNSIMFTVTDVEISVSEVVNDKVFNDITINIPAIHLFNIIKKIPKNAFSMLYIENNLLYIKSNTDDNNFQSLFSLPYNKDNYPMLETNNEYQKIHISGKELIFLIEKTKFSMSQDSTRYNLSGVNITLENKYLSAASTDIHRLSMANIEIKNAIKEKISIIIPKKTILELPKIIEPNESFILSINRNNNDGQLTKIHLKSKNKEIISKLIAGLFPDCKSIVPKDHLIKIVVNKDKILDSLNRVSVIFNDKNHGASLEIVNNEKILLKANSSISMSAEEHINLEKYICKEHIERFIININYQYLIDALLCIDSKNAELLFTNDTSPVIVKSDTRVENDKQFLYIIMPMVK